MTDSGNSVSNSGLGASLDGSKTSKKLILNAFVESCSGHQSPGLWQHPKDRSFDFNNVKHWTELAQLLEKGKFHGIFIADVLVLSTRIEMKIALRLLS